MNIPVALGASKELYGVMMGLMGLRKYGLITWICPCRKKASYS